MHNKTNTLRLRTWVEINQKAIAKNHAIFRKAISPKTKLMGVVKSNAYGNELIGFSKALTELGVDFFGVDSIAEGLALRDAGITHPILILGYTLPENFLLASEKDIIITISSKETLAYLQKFSHPIRAHVKIDTGMHRQGFFSEESQKICDMLKKMPNLPKR